MLQQLLAAAFVLLAVFNQSPKQTPFQCLTQGILRETLTENIPDIEIAELARTDAQQFLQLFNSLPPQTAGKADSVLLLGMKNAQQIVIAFFKNNCMTGRAVLPRPLVEQLLLQIERSGA